MTIFPDEPTLDEFLDEAERPADYEDDPDHPQPWRPRDDGAAEWCLQHLASAEEALSARQRLADDRISLITEWRERVSKPLVQSIAHWRGLLEDYVLRRRAESKDKVKSISLPSGELSTRASAEAVEIEAKDALLAWLLPRTELESTWCEYKPFPKLAVIKAAVEVVDGSVCRYCGEPLVRGMSHGNLPRLWLAASGDRCPTAKGLGAFLTPMEAPGFGIYAHAPFMEDGEEKVIRVATYNGTPVPGLAVRPPSVSAIVKATKT